MVIATTRILSFLLLLTTTLAARSLLPDDNPHSGLEMEIIPSQIQTHLFINSRIFTLENSNVEVNYRIGEEKFKTSGYVYLGGQKIEIENPEQILSAVKSNKPIQISCGPLLFNYSAR